MVATLAELSKQVSKLASLQQEMSEALSESNEHQREVALLMQLIIVSSFI